VRASSPRPYAALPALCLLCCALPLLLSGCSMYNRLFHRSHDIGCSEKPFRGNTENLAGLVVPEGMTPPDSRNQVRIPSLNEPERVRAKTEPCLAQPPSYKSGTSIAIPVHTGTPMGAPAPAPVPIEPTTPTLPMGPSVPSVPQVPVVPAPVPESTPPAAPDATPAAPKPQ
jgi:hypothetical protein